MTWTGWDKLRNVADERGIIYKRGDCSISPYVQAIDDLLIMKNATDVGLIFEDERGAQRLAVHYYLSWFTIIFTLYSAQLVLLCAVLYMNSILFCKLAQQKDRRKKLCFIIS